MVPSLRVCSADWWRLVLLLLGLTLPVARPASAQDIAEQMRQVHRTYTTREGLPQSSANALTVDTRGWVWVGTEDGAAYYNGRVWTPVPLPDAVTSPIVTWGETLVADSTGAIWMGLYGGGLCRVRPIEGVAPERWTWEIVPASALGGHREIWAVHLGRTDGTVWVGTEGGGLFIGSATDPARGWRRVETPNELHGHILWAVDEDADGSLWVGTDGAGLWRRGINGRWTDFRAAAGPTAGPGNDRVRAVHSRADGTLWVGTDGSGVATLRPDGSWSHLTTADGLANNGVGAIHESPDGSLWFGTGGGVSRLRGGRWHRLSRPNGLIDDVVFAIGRSGDGALWFGTRRGVSVYHEGGWSTLVDPAGRLSQLVYALHERPDGTLWFGTWGSGILTYNPANGAWQHHAPGPYGLRGDNVQAFAERTDGSLWASVWREGLAVYRSGGWSMVRPDEGPGTDDIRALQERPDGALWAGGWNGLRLDSAGLWRHPPIGPLGSHQVFCLLERPDGSLWVGTDSGLAVRRAGGWSVRTQADGLPSDHIRAIHAGADGTLWIGTDGGLVALDSTTLRVFTDTIAGRNPVLPNRFVHQIQSDRRGRVYVLTNRGIARLTASDRGPLARRAYRIETFSLADGLPSLDGSRSGSMVDHRGRVWFATVGGVVMLDPTGPSPQTGPPSLSLGRLEVSGLPHPDRLRYLDEWQRRTGQVSPLKLTHDQNSLTVEVALMAFNPEAVTYQVQLIGYDRSPLPWTADPRKAYMNLPAGSYTFVARGRDGRGRVSEPIRLDLVIAPAPWLTWWAWLAYLSALIAAIVGLVNWRSDVTLRRAETRATLERERLFRLAAEADARTALAERAAEAQTAALERERLTRLAAEAEADAARTLRRADEFRERVMSSAANAISAIGLDGTFTLVNRQMCELSGYTADELIGHSWKMLVAPGEVDEIAERFKGVGRDLVPATQVEANLVRRDGRIAIVMLSLAPLQVDGQLVGFVGAADDITERKAAAAQLSRMAAVIEQSSESILITDPDGAIVYVNPAFERVSGYTAAEVQGRNPRLLQSGQHDAAFFATMWRTLRAGRIWQGEIINRHKAGGEYVEDTTILPIKDASGHILHFAAVKRDITQTRQLEEQLRQSQKLEAIGQLAGGIAHDFNNILTVISGYAGLALLRTPAGSPVWGYVHQIKKEGTRAANLTRQLLAVSRKQQIEPRPLDLAYVLTDLHQLLVRLIGEDISLEVMPPPHPCWIKADPSQIEQVFVNLVVNARDAIRSRPTAVVGADPVGHHERSVTIQTAAVELDERAVGRQVGSAIGPHVLITVTDTGIGMGRDVMAKIFEPFFTTKAVGQGTGLGLATVYGIVRQNGGSIQVNSEPGVGTTFRIYWPATPPAPSARRERSPARAAGSKIDDLDGGGEELVLLVEDEDAVRRFASDTLLALGYRVVEAVDGLDALRKIETTDQPFALVFTDLVMPRMGGEELIKRLNERVEPCPKVLYASGYSDGGLDSTRTDGRAYLAKPYSVEGLARAVRLTLNGEPSELTLARGNRRSTRKR